MDQTDEVLVALENAAQALRQNAGRLEYALERTTHVRDQRLSGMTYADILGSAERPLIVEVLSAILDALQHAGHQLRSAEARTLRAEGLSTNRIAELFGVSRQRVSALLRPDPAVSAPFRQTPPQGEGETRLDLRPTDEPGPR